MRTLLVFVFLFVSGAAQGQECRQRALSSRPHYLPPGLFCEIAPDGMMCFNLEEYKQLLKMDAELHAGKEKVREKDSIITNQALILNQQNLTIDTLESDKKILDERAHRLDEKWRACMAEQEGLPWSSIGLGAGTGVIIGAIVGVIAYLTVEALSK
jgi:ElaB/YqjD/DUF883 family membrane-anchored ribosome-binding protein